METTIAVRERIIQLCKERNYCIQKLAMYSGLAPSSIKNILYGKSKNPTIISIKMICDGLDISLPEFFNTPEFEALPPEIE